MKRSASMPAFKVWLVKCGAIVDPPTNEYEVLRCRSRDGTLVIYRDKRGAQTWPEALANYFASFTDGNAMALSPTLKGRERLRHRIAELAERDGLWCWFCENGFLSADSAEVTIEHLCPKAHGGPDHSSNLVLACWTCNNVVGNWSIAEKVRYRDQKRGFACEPKKANARC